MRIESTDVPGYGFICETLVNTLLLWVCQPAAFDTSILPVVHLHFGCVFAVCLLVFAVCLLVFAVCPKVLIGSRECPQKCLTSVPLKRMLKSVNPPKK